VQITGGLCALEQHGSDHVTQEQTLEGIGWVW